jgi:ferric-dicitrate binding protein FerR (iron transport regulator)
MMADKERFLLLLFKSSSAELSPSEQQEMWDLITDPENQEYLDKILQSYWEGYPFNQPVLPKGVQTKILENIVGGPPAVERRMPKRFIRPLTAGILSMAAVLLLILGILFFRQDGETKSERSFSSSARIDPGGNKATLTLPDGSKISLDEVRTGIVAGEKLISKNSGGHLVYAEAHAVSIKQGSGKPQYHTITTPKGGIYQVTLPDGTHVYLNSGSSLRYPTVFSADRREVEATGELYFDVAKLLSNRPAGGRVPFIVHTGNQRIEVLGTQFNLNAYADSRNIKTTLVEGSVKIRSKALDGTGEERTVQLSPGYQVVNNFEVLTVKKADVNQAVAWKSGYFVFDNDNIREIMRQLARWYNIDVSYVGDMKGKRFGGIFKRSKSIFQIMENIEQTGSIDFKTEGRRVTVIAN